MGTSNDTNLGVAAPIGSASPVGLVSVGADHKAAATAASVDQASRHGGKGMLGSPGLDAKKAQCAINADPDVAGDMPAGGEGDGSSDVSAD